MKTADRERLLGQWQAYDQVLMLLNGLDVPDDMSADRMRRRIYNMVMTLRPVKEKP